VEKSTQTEAHRRLADLLRELRLEAGLTQAQVAERLRDSPTFIAAYEEGDERLDLVELARVADALGTSLVTLVQRWDNRSAP
jgi:transcriptional regulator with XRE-family HTH domain